MPQPGILEGHPTGTPKPIPQVFSWAEVESQQIISSSLLSNSGVLCDDPESVWEIVVILVDGVRSQILVIRDHHWLQNLILICLFISQMPVVHL